MSANFLSVYLCSRSLIQRFRHSSGLMVCLSSVFFYLVLVGGRTGSWISLQSALRALTHARLPFLGASVVGGSGHVGRSSPHPPEGRWILLQQTPGGSTPRSWKGRASRDPAMGRPRDGLRVQRMLVKILQMFKLFFLTNLDKERTDWRIQPDQRLMFTPGQF